MEKKGGILFHSSTRTGLQHFITTYGLVDLGFNGNPFTGNNGRLGGVDIRECLDHGLTNQAWRVLFLNTLIIHAPASASDHLHLRLNTNGHGNVSRRPFRFEAMWVHDPESFFAVAAVWAMHVDGGPFCILSKKLDRVKIALCKWNKLHFEFIKDRLHSLSCQLDRVQQAAPTLANKDLELSIKGAITQTAYPRADSLASTLTSRMACIKRSQYQILPFVHSD